MNSEFKIFIPLVVVVLLAFLVFSFKHLSGQFVQVSSSVSATVYPAVILALTNADRIANAVPTLMENPLLDQAAQMKADDMMQRGYYSHTSPEGYLPFYWLDKAGYKYLNVGENLDLTYIATDEEVNSAWMNSPEHRSNILLPQFTETGVGVASGVYNGEEVTFVVQEFATPLPPPPVTTPKAVPTAKTLPPAKPILPFSIPVKKSVHKIPLSSSEIATPIPYSLENFSAAVHLFIDSIQKISAL